MKKTVLVVAGLVVLIGAGLLISRPEKSGEPEGLERAQGTQGEGGGAQASVTEGREASASPENERVRSVKNDVLDKLLRQKELPEGLGLQRAEMAFMTSRPPEGGTANREGNAEVGTEADRELLVSQTTDDNRQIAEAVKRFLEKMDARN